VALNAQASSQKANKAKKEAAKRMQRAANEKKKKENAIEMDGVVLMHSRNIFKVMLSNGIEVQCTLAGKLRMNNIKVLEGDKVQVEMSPFDLTRGRITLRTIDRTLLETEQETKAREKAEEKARAKMAKGTEEE